MFDIRYHWLTLAALFFALGLGILIGTGLADRGAIAGEHARLAEQLEASLARLRDENRALRQAAERLERELRVSRETMDMLARVSISDRLAGRTFVLVVPDVPGEPAAPERASADEAIRSASGPAGVTADRWAALLESAGARVVRGTTKGGPVALALTQDDPQGESAPDQHVMAIYVNPPPNVPIPDGWRGAVVWDGAPAEAAAAGPEPDGGGAVLPSDWLVLRAGEGPLGEWALVEGLHRGWRGYLDVSGFGEGFPARLAALAGIETGGR